MIELFEIEQTRLELQDRRNTRTIPAENDVADSTPKPLSRRAAKTKKSKSTKKASSSSTHRGARLVKSTTKRRVPARHSSQRSAAVTSTARQVKGKGRSSSARIGKKLTFEEAHAYVDERKEFRRSSPPRDESVAAKLSYRVQRSAKRSGKKGVEKSSDPPADWKWIKEQYDSLGS